MISKWITQNHLVMRAACSTGAVTALTLVLAAPGKWNGK